MGVLPLCRLVISTCYGASERADELIAARELGMLRPFAAALHGIGFARFICDLSGGHVETLQIQVGQNQIISKTLMVKRILPLINPFA